MPSPRLDRRTRRTLRVALPAALGLVPLGIGAWFFRLPGGDLGVDHVGRHALVPVDQRLQGQGGPAELRGVRAVALHPSGTRGWAVAEDSGQLVALDLSGAPRSAGSVDAPDVRDLALVPGTDLLVGAAPDRLEVWRVATDPPVPVATLATGAAGLAVGATRSGAPVVASLSDGAVQLWTPSAAGLEPGPTLAHPDLKGARSGAFARDGTLVVAGAGASALVVLSATVAALVHEATTQHATLDGVDAVAVHDEATVVAAAFCGHQLSTWRLGDGGTLLPLASTQPAAAGGCAPVVEANEEEGVLHPTALAVLQGGRVAVTGLSPLLDLRTYLLGDDGTLAPAGALQTQPDWLDYSRFPWAAPESEGDGPPLPPSPRDWRDRADVATNGRDLLVAGFIPDALAWVPADGAPAFLHKGTGGATDLAGAYNLEIAADGASVYAAPRAEPELVLAGLSLDEDGSLAPLSVEALQPDVVGAGAMLNVTLSPDGEHVYAVDADYGGLHTYARSPEGALERAVRRQIPDCAGRPPMAVDVVTSHDGRQVYVADFQWEDPSCVHVFGVDEEGLALEVSQTVAAEELGGVEALAPTPDGAEVLAACHQAEAVTRLARDPDTGHLTLLQAMRRDDLAGAEFVVLSPDGRSVYASSPVSDTVVVFGRDTDAGNLTWLQTLTAGPDLPLVDAAGLAVTEDGQHVLVAARISNTVSLFARGADGRLSLEHQVTQGDAGVDGLTWVNGVDVHKNRVVTAAVADGAVSSFRLTDAPGG